MKIKVTGLNPNATAKRLYKNDRVGILLAESAARLMDPFVPFKTGSLSQTYQTKPFKIIYLMPYAHRQFNGVNFNFNKEHHPNATAHWDKAFMKAKGSTFIDEADKIITHGR